MFKVPIVPSDLRHEETIIQAAYALDCLQNTIATIFGRIDNRIEKNNIKVNALQERIKISQAKIISLQGTRKAIRIYAPARFPATKIFKDLPVTFNGEDNDAVKLHMKYLVQNKFDTNLPNLNEKLTFFHVRDQSYFKLTQHSKLALERFNIKQNQDLGNMPTDLRSVPSVLLFNTDISLYNFDECDNDTVGQSEAWKRAKLLRNKRQHGNYQQGMAKQILDPAPHSLVHRGNEKLTPSGSLKYTPKLSEAPELDLPLDLPDLPGIADDLRYDSPETDQRIAPSLAAVVVNLPELTELIKDSKTNVPILLQQVFNNTRSPLPPPPPPMPLKQSTAPPPPPPPPQATEHQANLMKRSTIKETKTSSEYNTDTRSELMAAIRSAGGAGNARLRTTAAAPLAANDNDVVDNTRPLSPSTKQPISLRSCQGGDLLADLHNKLLMRRKGISGSKDKSDKSTTKNIDNKVKPGAPSGNPVISRLSSLIPPPAIKRTVGTAANTSEDDDENDSNDTDWVD